MKINWSIDNRFHCGGYAKCPNYLKEFIINFEKKHNIILDPVYTGKLFYGLSLMISNNEFLPNTNIVVLHTGGEQGRRGYSWFS
jgi:1-aminocyclopropane-1-carboxylate deaminase